MPWNNQNGGGWKSGGGGGGGGGPWGQGGGGGHQGGGGQQPDLEEILKRSQDRMKQVMPTGGLPGWTMFMIALVIAAIVGAYASVFIVKPDELGVVLRFGKYVRQEGPGLHLKWPDPIEEVIKPSVTRENRVELGMLSAGGTRGGLTRDVPQESLMLTGDENIVDVDFVVVWRIKSEEQDEKTGQAGVEKFLFNIQNPESTVKEVAESAMREVVGKSDIQPILTADRQKTEVAVRDLMQHTLDSYDAGIKIVRVQMQKVDPPGKVIDAFRDVQAAKADQERIQNEARGYANKVVPEARGEAERILQAAEGYKQQTVQEALGQASRFEQVYTEYAKAPEVTRKRMFLETMERVFKDTDKIILDSNGKNGGSGVVPYLPLDQLRNRSEATGGGR
ncbi:MAG: FtsH protease activity modulator HflK [Alphaproteobacteria bacterium]|nr:FtsH protease activity modulator HflK [Alphaproteobacteria bacterium]